MDWRERLMAAGLRPAHGGGGCSMWLDRWERTIQIDWQLERFTYRCATPERAAAFTPGMSYPLELLVESDLSPAVSTVPLVCAVCRRPRQADQAAEACRFCGCRDSTVLQGQTLPITPVQPVQPVQPVLPPKRRKRDDGLKQLSLF
jgi:hypothetical protein